MLAANLEFQHVAAGDCEKRQLGNSWLKRLLRFLHDCLLLHFFLFMLFQSLRTWLDLALSSIVAEVRIPDV